MSSPVLTGEQKRLEALRQFAELELSAEEGFQDLAIVASQAIGVPTAIVSLIDEHYQVYLGKVGSEVSAVPREQTFCTHAILGTEVMIVPDARQDSRFVANPHVTCANGVRFYAGAPILAQDGEAIGSVCVIDQHPRTLTAGESESLAALARAAMRLLEQARLSKLLAEALTEVKSVQGLLPICCSCKGIRSDSGYWSSLEDYLSKRAEVTFSHGVCPDCMVKLYPGYCDSSGSPQTS